MRHRNFAHKKYLFLDALQLGKFKGQNGNFGSRMAGLNSK
jgi:hypothetical protein